MYVPAIDYDKEQVDRAVAAVRAKFPYDIERIVYSVRDDWVDEPYFWR